MKTESDYPWRELDRNDTHVLWERVQNGEYNQSITLGNLPPPPNMRCMPEFRAELGHRGWVILNQDRRPCGGYIPRYVSVDAVSQPVAPEPPKWPTRSSRVAILAAEMSIPLTDRLKRLP